ncbi:hypothetical protein V6N11_067632 [Hibiscus sabdariffa]|uniref:Uncharacterized protein n=1 Tax=Hibiscus sabdariffa TaxID=183260 RepID=A0ABR2SRF1_9ROSI
MATTVPLSEYNHKEHNPQWTQHDDGANTRRRSERRHEGLTPGNTRFTKGTTVHTMNADKKARRGKKSKMVHNRFSQTVARRGTVVARAES